MKVRARIEAIEQRVKHLAQAEGSRCPTCGGFGPRKSCVIICDEDELLKSRCPTCKWRVDEDGKAYPCDRVPAKGKVYVKQIIIMGKRTERASAEPGQVHIARVIRKNRSACSKLG